jgi:hypothetical protein
LRDDRFSSREGRRQSAEAPSGHWRCGRPRPHIVASGPNGRVGSRAPRFPKGGDGAGTSSVALCAKSDTRRSGDAATDAAPTDRQDARRRDARVVLPIGGEVAVCASVPTTRSPQANNRLRSRLRCRSGHRGTIPSPLLRCRCACYRQPRMDCSTRYERPASRQSERHVGAWRQQPADGLTSRPARRQRCPTQQTYAVPSRHAPYSEP